MIIHIAVLVAAIALNLIGMIATLAVGAAIGKPGTVANMKQSEKDSIKVTFVGGSVCLCVSFLLVALLIIDGTGV